MQYSRAYLKRITTSWQNLMVCTDKDGIKLFGRYSSQAERKYSNIYVKIESKSFLLFLKMHCNILKETLEAFSLHAVTKRNDIYKLS